MSSALRGTYYIQLVSIFILFLGTSNNLFLKSLRVSQVVLPLDTISSHTLPKQNSDCSTLRVVKKIKHNTTKKQKFHQKKVKKSSMAISRSIKKWTIMIYVAADNDLNFYAWKNIKQMEKVGSNEQLNIIIQVSERGRYKPTQRYIVEKNHLQKIDFGNKKLNSGSINTLINFCGWAIKTCPAEHYALILWNHGTGAKEPSTIKSLNTSELFVLNPTTNMLELDRSISFFDFISLDHKTEKSHRGICIDESHHSYISNTELDYGLNKICKTYLKNKKFDLIGFDACFMQMIEIMNIIQKYADIMVGSQEVELGAGWNYQHILKLFSQTIPTPEDLAKHIVQSYQQITSEITSDFTLSAINLHQVAKLEENINQVAALLIHCLEKQQEHSVKDIIKMCKSRRLCETFDEPSYIDLHNFYTNILKYIHYFKISNSSQDLISKLKEKLLDGTKIIEEIVIANCSGKNLARAQGISIYFPDIKPHNSYQTLPFAQNSWFEFLKQYCL